MTGEPSTAQRAYSLLPRLLRAELWGENHPVSELTVRDYGELMQLAHRQTVDGLVCSALTSLNVKLPKEQVFRTIALLGGVERRNQLLNHAVAVVSQLLHKHDVRFLIVKGQTIAALYPHPLTRIGGDVDLYVYPDDFERALKLFVAEWQVDIDEHSKADGQHVNFEYKGVEFELHFCLMKFASAANQRIFDRFVAQSPLDKCYIDGVGVPVLDDDLNMVYTFLHLYHHLVELGVGLRQFCDVAVLLYRLHGRLHPERISSMLTALGFTRAFKAVEAVLTDYLGLAETYLPLPVNARDRLYANDLLNIVFLRGNFGQYGRKTKVRSGWAYYRESFFMKVGQYYKFYRLSPKENRAAVLHSIPRKIKAALNRMRNEKAEAYSEPQLTNR